MLIGQLRTNRFFSGVIKIASAGVIAQLISFAALQILTRLYTTEEYGILGFYFAVVTILTVPITMNYEGSIAIPKRDEDGLHLFLLSTCIAFALGIVSLIVLEVWGEALFLYFDVPLLLPYRHLVPLGAFLYGTYNCFANHALRQQMYHVVARTNVMQACLQAVLQIGGGLLKIGAWGLLIGDIGNRSGGMTLLFKRTFWTKWNEISFRPRWSEIMRLACVHKQFPLYGMPSDLLLTLGISLPPLFIGQIWGASTLGLYVLALKIADIPTFLIGSAVGRVFYAEASKAAHTSFTDLYKLFVRTATKLFLFAVLAVPMICVIFYYTVDFLFGKDWSLAGLFALYLIPMIIVRVVTSPLSQISGIIKKQNVELVMSITRVATFVGLFLYIKGQAFAFERALLWYSLANTVLYILFFIMYLVLVKQKSTSGDQQD